MVIAIVGAAALLLILWAFSCRRRLTAMNESIDNAMTQIGVQLSACFTALNALQDLAREYVLQDSKTLFENVESFRCSITSIFTPDFVLRQESVIAETLDRISTVAERYPDLKADKNYAKCMNAVDGYEKMVRTSCLIYNDSAARLNRELRMFPTSLIAGVFGFRKRDYLEVAEGKTDQCEI